MIKSPDSVNVFMLKYSSTDIMDMQSPLMRGSCKISESFHPPLRLRVQRRKPLLHLNHLSLVRVPGSFE